MDEVNFSGEKHIVPLKDILEVYGQPVTEEQAYALCYQCCCKLMNLAWDHQPVPELNGVENLLLRVDGMVSFASSGGTWEDNHSVKEILKCLGHILYTALDWGLTEELERDLTEPMADMLCSMLGFETVSNSSAIDFQHSVTLDEIKQICAERLFLPGQASIHYQTVCRTYFAEHLEFKKLLATINQSKQSLEILETDDFMKKDPLPRCTSWGDLWRKVVKELRLGIRLRCVKDRSYIGLTVVHTLTAHQRLMRDIRSRRYTLRKVKDKKTCKMDTSDDNFITAFIRERPLKPASERTLRERTPEEPSLHELLMTEIKSSTKLRLSSSPKSKDSEQDADFMLSERLFGTQISDSGLGVRARKERSHWSSSDLLDDGSEVKIIWQADSNSDSDSKLSDIADLTFFPVLTSSQVDLKINSFLNNKARSFIHKRSSSQGYFQKIGTGGKPNKQSNFQRSLPLTIEELVLARQATVKMEISDFLGSNGCSEHRVCFSCHKKRFFFSWPYTCKMCERVNCHECSIEMSMPFKQCMHLPISFFKSLVLTQEDDPDCKANKCTTFYKETLNWDSSIIPLVFEPKGLTEEVPSHKKSMRNWTCMDICIKCEEYLLDTLNKSQLVAFPICGLKGRSASVS